MTEMPNGGVSTSFEFSFEYLVSTGLQWNLE